MGVECFLVFIKDVWSEFGYGFGGCRAYGRGCGIVVVIVGVVVESGCDYGCMGVAVVKPKVLRLLL